MEKLINSELLNPQLNELKTRRGKDRTKDYIDFRLPLKEAYDLRSLGIASTTQIQIVKNILEVVEKYPFIRAEILNRSKGIK
jgi:hypothetical protein